MSEISKLERNLIIKKIDDQTVNISINDNEMLMSIVGQFDQNLKQLSKIGTIRTIYDGSLARFDWNTASHNHFKCIECGKMTDIEIASPNTSTKRKLDNNGFDVLDVEITFIGICKEHKNNK